MTEPTAFMPGTSQLKAYTGTAASIGNAFGAHIRWVRVMSTTDCFISFIGTATGASLYLPAMAPEYFRIREGQTLSAIRVAASGTIYATECDF